MEELKKKLNKLLKKHGYGFQYSVLELVHILAYQKKSSWFFEVAEFPAEVQGAGTKIDFMLRLKNTRIYIVAECKRVDPKFSNWCFIKAPYVRQGQRTKDFFVDRVRYDKMQMECRAVQDVVPVFVQASAYHIGLVVKSREKGEGGKPEKDAIEKAATQVCRGVNGLIDLAEKKAELITSGADNDPGAIFIPVIFTTAKLYSCPCELQSAELETGNLDISDKELTEEYFVYYQYHLSPGIKHEVEAEQKARRFSEVLDYEYVRTIPIVTASGIEDFLCSFGGEICRTLGLLG